MKIFLSLFIIVVLSSCTGPIKYELTVKNNLDQPLKDVLIELPLADLKSANSEFNEKALLVYNGEDAVPCQLDDRNQDGQNDMLILVTDLQPNEERELLIISTPGVAIDKPYAKRTQAELSHKVGGKFEDKKYIGGKFENISYVRVPDEHTDHSSYFRYEGPGWESDKVGYRFYLDWRNATDIFGKKTTEMVLQNVGQDGYDSYHEMADWGVDVLKVGSTLGIGSIGMWSDSEVKMVSVTDSITCAIAANGPVYSRIQTDYSGWLVGDKKYNLQSKLSIAAGDRKTRHDVVITAGADNICTGIVKHKMAELLESSGDSEWQYLATFGAQTLVDEQDLLGMAVLYKKSNLIERADDGQSHIVILKPEKDNVTYYFLAAWGQEPGGITTEEQFRKYLELEILLLDNPPSVKLSTSQK